MKYFIAYLPQLEQYFVAESKYVESLFTYKKLHNILYMFDYNHIKLHKGYITDDCEVVYEFESEKELCLLYDGNRIWKKFKSEYPERFI